jgi:hypothetical protein
MLGPLPPAEDLYCSSLRVTCLPPVDDCLLSCGFSYAPCWHVILQESSGAGLDLLYRKCSYTLALTPQDLAPKHPPLSLVFRLGCLGQAQ